METPEYKRISKPIEELIKIAPCESAGNAAATEAFIGSGYINCPSGEQVIADCDVLIIGSGYGGAIAAHRLSDAKTQEGKPLRVIVLERGKEFAFGEFPESLGDLPGQVRFQRERYEEFFGHADALFDARVHKDLSVLVANGLGGGSLINANVALEPEPSVFQDSRWPAPLREPDSMKRHFEKVRILLKVKTPKPEWMPKKYHALRRVADYVGTPEWTGAAVVKPAPITVDLDKCTKCGNCITGCNVGAKQTLPLTVLAQAKGQGAEMYTGATVVTVQRCADDQDWLVRLRRTATEKNVLREEVFQIRSRIVILAAGTLGTTEILLRSKKDTALPCSATLGHQFSANGDTIAFGYAGAREVLPTGKSSDAKHEDPGPTITGYARVHFNSFTGARPGVIQDASVPLALNKIFGELITTASLIARYTLRDPPRWFYDNRSRNLDPLVVHQGAINHSQVVLFTGHDSAEGTMKLAKRGDNKEFQLYVEWPRVAKGRGYHALDKKFEEGYKRGFFKPLPKPGIFDGGYYLPNPAWKAMPENFERVVTGAPPESHVFTVHPLGGCAMADDATRGVVNHWGQVFTGSSGAQVYEGLYVMDGAMIPGSLGVNPFLTIAAVAHRNSTEIRERIESGKIKLTSHARPPNQNPANPAYAVEKANPYATQVLDTKPTIIDLRERLALRPAAFPQFLNKDYKKFIDAANRAVQRKTESPCESEQIEQSDKKPPPQGLERPLDDKNYYRLALTLNAEMNIDRWLIDPDNVPITGKVELFLDPSQSVPVSSANQEQKNEPPLLTEPVFEHHLVRIASGTCKVRLVRHLCQGSFEATKRWWQVASEARKRRKGSGLLEKATNGNELSLTVRQHTYWRNLEYEFTLKPCAEFKGIVTPFTLTGKKRLGYSKDHKNLWNALLELDLEVKGGGNKDDKCFGRFQVDVTHLLDKGLPQVISSPHMPATIMNMSRLGLFALRLMFQTHLWSFEAPEYKHHAKPVPELPGPIPGYSFSVKCIEHDCLDCPPDECEPPRATKGTPHLRLARYGHKDDEGKEHLMLIHGLAHGGAVFTTKTGGVSMAEFFLRQGYVVWVLDHRLSPALDWEPHRRKVDMDHIAAVDIPLAVQHVYKAAGQPIHVFAHCIGAGAFAMAALNGNLWSEAEIQPRPSSDATPPKGKRMIERVVLHAVPPWLVPSPKSRINAKLAAFYKDSLRFDDPCDAGFDVIPPTCKDGEQPKFSEVLIDRFARSLSRSADDTLSHTRADDDVRMGRAVCDRLALWYSDQWNHVNISEEVHRNIASLVGFGNLEVFKQIYFCIERERLTDREGSNIYLKEENIKNHWTFHTMFIHGSDNRVFNPASSQTSAWKLNEWTRLLSKNAYDAHQEYDRPEIWHCNVEKYGHLDLVLGKQASGDVYPLIRHFFFAELKYKNYCDPPNSNSKTGPFDSNPTRGFHKLLAPEEPATGWIWFQPEVKNPSEVGLQVWLEPTRFATSSAHEGWYSFNKKDRQKLDIKAAPDTYGTYWLGNVEIPIATSEFAVGVYYKTTGPAACPPVEERISAPPEYFATSFLIPSESTRPKYGWLSKFGNRSGNRSSHLAFALGSCRHPGTPFERDASDAVYCAMLKNAKMEGTQALDFALFVGDQIYADATADIFDTTEVAERYWKRYRDAFRSPNMKALLQYLPAYFAVDDHEFEDDWLGAEANSFERDPKRQERLERAREAAHSYQGMAGFAAKRKANDVSKLPRFWHEIEGGPYPFFVLDTRTQRRFRQAGMDPANCRIMDTVQWNELYSWLNSKTSAIDPKFVACGSPLAPPELDVLRHYEAWRTSDTWLGFPGSLAELVKLVVDKGIQNLVLLSGDLHLSAYASMWFCGGNKKVRVHQVVASGLYSPLPFANTKPSELGFGRYNIPGSDYSIEFEKPTILTEASSHFLRVDVTVKDVKLTAYDSKGGGLKEFNFNLI